MGEDRQESGMWALLTVFLLLTWCPQWSQAMNISEYLNQREFVLAQEQTMILGQEQVLTVDEQAVNNILMAAKMAEMNNGFETLDFFPPAKNFMTVRSNIEASEVFQIIQLMPKGAGLHLHDTALASALWVVEVITYWPDLYMCYTTADDQLLFRFFQTPDTSCSWQLVSDVRASYPTPEEFDAEIFSRISLLTENPEDKYPDIDSVWQAFREYFISITDMLMYRPAWESYLYHALGEFAMDNVLYLEFRGTLPLLYELDGTTLTAEETMTVYNNTIHRFIQDNPDDCYGARFIYAPSRNVDNTTVEGYVNLVQDLKIKFPGLVAGFDIVGYEDKSAPLKDFLGSLLKLSDAGIPVFYHAGETVWMGMSSDENIIDALLLNTTRLGHGYALTKHPEAKALAMEKNVPLEVCPISNQVLMLVPDLRNHPIAPLVAEGFPIVVSSDDPGAWGAKGLSYDFYEAFMALGGAKADLRFLKQLAINSIMYSSLDENEKSELMFRWVQKWDEFLAITYRLHTNNSKKFFPKNNSNLQPGATAPTTEQPNSTSTVL